MNDDFCSVVAGAAVRPAIMVKREPVNCGGGVHADTSSAYVATGMKVPYPMRSIMTMHAVSLSPLDVPLLEGIVTFEVGVAGTMVVVVRKMVITSLTTSVAGDVDCTVVVRVCVVCTVRVCETETEAVLAGELGAPVLDAEPETYAVESAVGPKLVKSAIEELEGLPAAGRVMLVLPAQLRSLIRG